MTFTAAATGPWGTSRQSVHLRVSDLYVKRGDRQVIRGVDMEVGSGEIVGLIGPNGVGKSTMLLAITSVIDWRGNIRLDGRPLPAIPRREVARRIAVVQQAPEAPGYMRVAELALLGRHPHLSLLGRESPHDREITMHALELAGCADLAERALNTLSGGERRRAFIARALAQEPALLLLDEPTSSLDIDAQVEVFELLRGLANQGLGVLVVEHDLTLACAYCDRVALIAQGRIRAQGIPTEVVTAESVRAVYGDRTTVMPHPETGRPVVIPRMDRG
ncbi:MAG TPA: ABC transporter ATP-binding protein [Dehalococcoidia bacterium]|nr:ABC transporter ATP-binding protein [Dehalococcoidia bacterium]